VDILPFSSLTSVEILEAMSDRIQQRDGPTVIGKRQARKAAGVTQHGQVTQAQCDGIMKEVRNVYIPSGSTEETRSDFLWVLAEAAIGGTSRDTDFEAVEFTLGDVTMTLAPLAQVCNRMINHANPVRAFLRNYNKGEIALKCYDLLNNPENVALRSQAVLRYESTYSNARFCFDIVKGLLLTGIHFTEGELHNMDRISRFQIQKAQIEAQSKGYTNAVPDRADHAAGNENDVPVTTTTPTERGGFRPLR